MPTKTTTEEPLFSADHPKNLAEALSKAQMEFPDIPRNKSVTVKTGTGHYEFSYCPLDSLIKITRPALVKYGLAITQLINKDGNAAVINTRLMHVSGETIESVTPVVQSGVGPQAFGSAITYARRYSMAAILNIQAEEDDDANVDQGNAVTPRQPAAVHPQQPSPKRAAPVQNIGSQAVLLKSFTPKVGKSGTEYFEATFGDGRKASTFNKDDAMELMTQIGNKVSVILTPSKDGRFLNISLPEVESHDDGLDGFVEPGEES